MKSPDQEFAAFHISHVFLHKLRSVPQETTTALVMAAAIKFGDRNYGLQIGENHGSVTPHLHLPPGRL
jgi:hypothetical protein